MGEARFKAMNDRDYALSRSLFCIFCGGVKPANSAEHYPPKAVFTERRFPEGYVFPACQECNSGSRHQDKVIAFLSRMSPSVDEKLPSEILKLFKSLLNERPKDIRQFFTLSAVNKKRAAEQMRYQRPPGALYRDLPFVKVPDWIDEIVNSFIQKLTKALHFHHTNLILPSTGVIESKWFTNANHLSGQIPEEIFTLPTEAPKLFRANVDLSEQFNYRYLITEDGQFAMYSVHFRFAFCFTSVLAFDKRRWEDMKATIRDQDSASA